MEVIKNPGDETDTFRDQIKTGKLNVSDLYPNDQKEEVVRGEIKIGKIKTKVIFGQYLSQGRVIIHGTHHQYSYCNIIIIYYYNN